MSATLKQLRKCKKYTDTLERKQMWKDVKDGLN